MSKYPEVVEGISFQGHVRHAVLTGDGSSFYTTMPRVMGTFRKALCGVGHAGLRITQDPDTLEPIEWSGRVPHGCDKCHRILLHRKEENGKA